MSKLIIEASDGGLYIYRENGRHHRTVEPQRIEQGLQRLD